MIRFNEPRAGPVVALVSALAMLGGICLGLLVTPWMVRNLTTDLLRVRFVLEALRDRDSFRCQYLVLGDSVAMNGLDAGLLSKLLPGGPPACNLAMPGQGLGETELLTQEIAPDRAAIVFFLDRRRLGHEALISAGEFNAYYLNGFRPDGETRRSILAHFPVQGSRLFDRGWLWHRFQGRWALRQGIEREARYLLRSDLDLRHALADLQNPRTHTSTSRAALGRTLEVYKQIFRSLPGQPSAAKVGLLDHLVQRMSRKAKRVVLLLPPVHPELLEILPQAYRETVDDHLESIAERSGASILNLTLEYDETAAVDAVHPSEVGANRITTRVAELLSGG